MRAILQNLNQTFADISASAIISIDGIVIASAIPQNVNEDTLGAMTAALLSIGHRSSRDLVNSPLEQIIVRNTLGYILVTLAGHEAALTVITKSHAELEPIMSEIKHYMDKINAHQMLFEYAY